MIPFIFDEFLKKLIYNPSLRIKFNWLFSGHIWNRVSFLKVCIFMHKIHLLHRDLQNTERNSSGLLPLAFLYPFLMKASNGGLTMKEELSGLISSSIITVQVFYPLRNTSICVYLCGQTHWRSKIPHPQWTNQVSLKTCFNWVIRIKVSWLVVWTTKFLF